MFKNSQSHTFFNEGKVVSKSGAVVLYRTSIKEDPSLAIKKFIGAGLITLFLGVLTLQAGWVYNASAEEGPISSPITALQTPTITPSSTSSGSSSSSQSQTQSQNNNQPITAPENPSPSPSASGNPITSPENTSKSVKVVNPNGGEVFTRGQTVNITWEGNGVPNYTLYLINVDYPQNPSWITTTYDANQKSYSWKIESLPGNYKVRVTSYPGDGSSISDDSDNYFTIVNAPVTSPEVSPSSSSNPSSNNGGSNNGGGNSGGGSSSSGGGSVGAPSCNNEAPKSAPKIVSAVTSGKNEITLTWEKAKDPVTKYVIAYGLEKGKPLYGNPDVGNVASYTVKGLSGGSTYFFKVRAGNDCQPGAYSEEIGVKVGGKFINSPAQGFKAGVLGKTIKKNIAIASANPLPQAPVKPQAQTNSGLFGKVFSFFSNFFKP